MSAALDLLDEVGVEAQAVGLTNAVRVGFPISLVDDLVAEGVLGSAELDRLVLPRKTLAHRGQFGRLSPDQSDRLLRLLRVIAHVHAAFGAMEKAARWSRRPTRALEGSAPLDTDIGARRVETLLGRIEHGIAA